jgi:glycosyltransferase involved in cell wall biosynthesis
MDCDWQDRLHARSIPRNRMKAGLVSTIIPVYNRRELLLESVESVLSQTYRPIEIIIIDDGSTDDTPAEADRLVQNEPKLIRVIHQSNSGPGAAREAGRQLAIGEFIQHLDSDDLLLPQKFQLQVNALKQNEHAGICYGKTRFYVKGESPQQRAWKRTGELFETMFPAFLNERWWGTSTPLYRKSVIDEAGPWLPLINEEDWEYDCRIAAKGVKLCYVNEFVSDHRDHDKDRLSKGGQKDPRKLKDRATAHACIYQHAQRAGLSESSAEMQHFSRSLFLLARQCGNAGLSVQSKDLFQLAKRTSGDRKNGLDFQLYSAFAAIVGWNVAGKVSCIADRLRT